MIHEIADAITIIEKVKNIFLSIGLFRGKIKYRKNNYYIESYKKHLTVYKNGNGILIVNLKLKIISPQKVKKISRLLDCSDGKKTLVFPKLENMRECDISDRFDNYGFWYTSDKNIVTGIEGMTTNQNKILNWKFIIDESKLKKGQSYNISYVISVPNMFPITNGNYDMSLLSRKNQTNYKFTSSLQVDHEIKEIEYAISFENGINFYEGPACLIEREQSNSNAIHGKEKQDLIYNTRFYKIKSPKSGSNIIISWKLRRLQNAPKKYKKKDNRALITSSNSHN